MGHLKRYLVEREIPGIGGMSIVELCGAARASNQAIDKLGRNIQWQHSYVSDDAIHCVYIAPNEDMVREHASKGGFPVTSVMRIGSIIDPATAE